MANRWLFGSGAASTMRTTGTITFSTSGTFRNGTYTDHAILLNSTGAAVYLDFTDAAAASDFVSSGETGWLHIAYYQNGTNNSSGEVLTALDGSDQPWLGIRGTSTGGVYGLYYNSGTGGSPVWTLIGSTFAMSTSSLHDIDVKLTLGSPHNAAAFVDGIEVASGDFTQASLTEIHAGRAVRPGSSQVLVSELIASAGYVTVGAHLSYEKPSGAGSNSGWAGSSADIDEALADDGDLISSGTAGQRSTFAYSDLPTLPSGYEVGDVFLWTRAKNDGTAPQNVKPVKRVGGSDAVGSAFSGIGLGWVEFLTRYSGISESDFNSAEFGVESST